MTDEWWDPPEYVDPLSGVPHEYIRIGDFLLGADADRDREVVVIYDIGKLPHPTPSVLRTSVLEAGGSTLYYAEREPMGTTRRQIRRKT